MRQAEKISVSELSEMSKKLFDPIVKAVVDARRRVAVFDAGLHA
jgi:hypothetical protein